MWSIFNSYSQYLLESTTPKFPSIFIKYPQFLEEKFLLESQQLSITFTFTHSQLLTYVTYGLELGQKIIIIIK